MARTPDLAVETGKAAQELPSFLRSICRSRFEFDVEELQDEHRIRAARTLEGSPIFARYAFPSVHAAILRDLSIEEFLRMIKKHTMRYELTFGCSYQRELRKRACWTCPVARSVIRELVRNAPGKEDENENTD